MISPPSARPLVSFIAEPTALCEQAAEKAMPGRAATLPAMSKRTNKRRLRARRKKANHGRKPNAGRKR